MSEALYMMEMEQLLEELHLNAITADGQELYYLKGATIHILISHYGLNPEDAESEVAAACGGEP